MADDDLARGREARRERRIVELTNSLLEVLEEYESFEQAAALCNILTRSPDPLVMEHAGDIVDEYRRDLPKRLHERERAERERIDHERAERERIERERDGPWRT
jgi:hypothetical protein